MISRGSLLVADILLIYVTWRKLSSREALLNHVRKSKRLSLSDILFRDGTSPHNIARMSWLISPYAAHRNYILRVRTVTPFSWRTLEHVYQRSSHLERPPSCSFSRCGNSRRSSYLLSMLISPYPSTGGERRRWERSHCIHRTVRISHIRSACDYIHIHSLSLPSASQLPSCRAFSCNCKKRTKRSSSSTATTRCIPRGTRTTTRRASSRPSVRSSFRISLRRPVERLSCKLALVQMARGRRRRMAGRRPVPPLLVRRPGYVPSSRRCDSPLQDICTTKIRPLSGCGLACVWKCRGVLLSKFSRRGADLPSWCAGWWTRRFNRGSSCSLLCYQHVMNSLRLSPSRCGITGTSREMSRQD